MQHWIDTLDDARMRAHAWDVWASITSPSGQDVGPVRQTWSYWPDGAVEPGDHQLFDGYTKTDFRWSIPVRAH